MNLTKMNGCYSKELYDNRDTIKDFYEDRTVSTETLRDFILEVIEPAWINAEAKRRFKSSLRACASKYDIYRLCNNSVNKAMRYTATPRTRAYY